MRAVAKYCDQYICVYVCVCVCLLVCYDISGTTHVIFNKFLCMMFMTVARFSSGRVTKSQGQGAILGVFFPIGNALYSIAFWTRAKTAEPIEMQFGMMSGLGLRNSVLCGGDDPRREGQFWGKCA